MKVVILGCGRVGARLAQLMEAEGHQVSIVDSRQESFDRLPETFKGETVLGIGIDADVLKAAGVEIDRKMLADLAVHDAAAFGAIAAQAKAALGIA